MSYERTLLLSSWIAAALGLSACGEREAAPPPAPAAPPAAAWQELRGEALSPGQAAQRARAEGARDLLASGLVGRLTQEVSAQGHAAAIRVCKTEAPLLAADVSRSEQVTIGRTSFKLRSRMNRVPDWAEPYVAQKRAEPAYLAHADGRFAALLPIRVQAACLACHGPAEQIAPDVKELLAREYPSDQATGFKEGDLRGWFWVEVPAAP